MTTLRHQMIETMQLRGLPANTQRAYLQAIQCLAEYYHRPPDEGWQRFATNLPA